MVHHYVLKEEASQYVSKYYNHKIIGASLEVHITEVSKEKVKVNVHFKASNIQFSTVLGEILACKCDIASNIIYSGLMLSNRYFTRQ